MFPFMCLPEELSLIDWCMAASRKINCFAVSKYFTKYEHRINENCNSSRDWIEYS